MALNEFRRPVIHAAPESGGIFGIVNLCAYGSDVSASLALAHQSRAEDAEFVVHRSDLGSLVLYVGA